MATRRLVLLSMLGGCGALLAGALNLSACVSTRGPSVPMGAPAPTFSLKSHLGGEISLEQLTQTGPAVIVFYRGFW